MAFGFYLATEHDMECLANELRAAQGENPGAPLITLVDGVEEEWIGGGEREGDEEEDWEGVGEDGDGWELV